MRATETTPRLTLFSCKFFVKWNWNVFCVKFSEIYIECVPEMGFSFWVSCWFWEAFAIRSNSRFFLGFPGSKKEEVAFEIGSNSSFFGFNPRSASGRKCYGSYGVITGGRIGSNDPRLPVIHLEVFGSGRFWFVGFLGVKDYLEEEVAGSKDPWLWF